MEDKALKWFIILCLFGVIIFGPSGSAFADETDGRWFNSNTYAPNYVIKAFDKLGRGVVNTVFGFIEIPKQTLKRAIDTKSSYGYASGLLVGIGYFVIREIAGVYEIVTFPIPLPSNFDPVMDPILLGYKL